MTEDEPTEESGDDEMDLTPEQRERIRRIAANWQGSALPKFDFKLPESVLRNFAGIAAQQSKFLDAFKPIIETQNLWKKQFELVNSDIFKAHAATQAQFAALSANLTKTIDFGGINDSFAKIAQQFATQQSSWLKTLGPTLERLRESIYPPNLRAIEDLRFADVEKVVMADAIALYGVPRTSIAEALILADSAAKRREILGRRWKAVSADCRAALGTCNSEAVASYAKFAVAAVDALDQGHEAAAQALAGSLIDTLLAEYFGKDRYKYTPDKKGKRTTEAYDEFSVRQFIAFAPMWQVYQQYWVADGDAVPHTFSRNATAHAVSTRQFSRRNAVQALLFACSLLYFSDEQAQRLGAA